MIRESIKMLVEGHSLTIEQAEKVMNEIMDGEATPAQFGAFVTALRLKGETVDEMIGMVKVMRQKAVAVTVNGMVVDTCGTGGDTVGTFNISTTAAFVAAGVGLKVAKHGNRAMSSHCGSADVLEALGIKIDLHAEDVRRCIEKVGIGFMYAPIFHPAMKYTAMPRREIGIRTIFNHIGPLTNPAGTTAQVIGVADGHAVEKIAMVLKDLGCQHALVVHGEDGLDEISISGRTMIYELKDDAIKGYLINPRDFGLKEASLDSIRGGTVVENAAILRDVLSGQRGPRRDIVLMNTAAVVLAGDKVDNLEEGFKLAEDSIDKGIAMQKLEQLITLSQVL
ncbi:MAG: anthranilate phosphoribosyltransferase [Dehalococcoidia bacterium]|nr:MAG: anthranilate phosphoribosyltransferase [Dehalococcoidia bacterium]